jgi:hypothetical protein
LVFLVTTLIWLARVPGPIGGGLLAGAAGYFLMASFNNPFLFIQISLVVFTATGFGLAESVRRRQFGDVVAATAPIETDEPAQPAELPEPNLQPGPPPG